MKNKNTKDAGVKKSNPVQKNGFVFAACMILALTFSANSYAINDAMKIKISNSTYSDELIMRFMPTATENFDSNYDSWKLLSANSAVPNLFSRIDSGYKLAINAMPAFKTTRKVCVYARIGVSGYYLIKGEELGAFAPGTSVMMQDKYTGQIYDLRSGKSYLINLPVITDSDPPRFEVIFISAVSVQTVSASCSSCMDGAMTFKKSGYKNWEYIVSNTSGTVASGISVIDSVSVLGLASGTYTLTINNIYGSTEKLSVVINGPSATGMVSYNNLTDVNVWSAGSNFMLEANFKSNTDLSLDVFDMSGQMLTHTEFRNIQSIQEEISTAGLSSGLYLVVARANNMVLTKKLVKTN